jgi:hypothetical protein
VDNLKLSLMWYFILEMEKDDSGKKSKRVDSLDGTFLRPIGR